MTVSLDNPVCRADGGFHVSTTYPDRVFPFLSLRAAAWTISFGIKTDHSNEIGQLSRKRSRTTSCCWEVNYSWSTPWWKAMRLTGELDFCRTQFEQNVGNLQRTLSLFGRSFLVCFEFFSSFELITPTWCSGGPYYRHREWLSGSETMTRETRKLRHSESAMRGIKPLEVQLFSLICAISVAIWFSLASWLAPLSACVSKIVFPSLQFYGPRRGRV